MLSLLDHSPLLKLIEENINTQRIYNNIDHGFLHGFGLNLLNYSNGLNTSFYYSKDHIGDWKRKFEINYVKKITPKYIWASSSIPIFFSPVKIDDCYYGDGGFRHHSPLNTAIHMGADKLLVIGVKNSDFLSTETHEFPSLAYIIGLLMNGLLNDSLDKDIERLIRTNEYVSENNRLKKLDIQTFFPSEDIQQLVIKYADQIPKFLHHLLRGLGQDKEAAMLISYLLFYPTYMQELIELGKKDFQAKKEDMLKFFND
jgi:NTE family protein